MGDAHDHIHPEPTTFLGKYVFSIDHKIIAKQFLFSSLLWLIVGGLLAVAVRHQIAWPKEAVPLLGKLTGERYNQLFTMHASVMIFLVVIPTLVGVFGNYCIPLMIGARDMAFPLLNALSYWFMWPGFACFILSFFVTGGPAGAGWTSYPPLSVLGAEHNLGIGQDLWLVGVFFIGTSSLMGAINYITTIVTLRAPGMGFFRMPLTVWALFITSILTLVATPVLGSAAMMQLSDRVLGSSFFIPAGESIGGVFSTQRGGQVLLFQHLFWFYSHPAVYIMILPAMGIVSDVLSTFSRKPVFGYRPMVYSISAIAGLGFIVWGHHMFQSGMNPWLGMTFAVSTIMIALPSAIKTFNWIGTLWGGRLHFQTPMLWAIGFVSMFVIGGLSGIFMAANAVDVHIHDTYFIVAHIHYVLFGGSIFGIFAGIYYWFPKMFGKMLHSGLGKLHFWLTLIFFNWTFFLMHIVGARGMMRRIADPSEYVFLRDDPNVVGDIADMNIWMTWGAIGLGLSQLVFFINFAKSLAAGEKAGANPWNANTLEWTDCSSPPWYANFETIPTVHRGPYEYSSPEVEEDYLPQSRDLAAESS